MVNENFIHQIKIKLIRNLKNWNSFLTFCKALLGAVLLTLVHLVVRLATLEFQANWKCELAAVLLIYASTHIVGVFNRYLVERAQRETFMETR